MRRLTGQAAEEALTDVSEVFRLESSHPNMSFVCRFQRALLTVVSRILFTALGKRTPVQPRSNTYGHAEEQMPNLPFS